MQTELRYQHLEKLIAGQQDRAENFANRFLQPSLFNTQFARGFGTLYTAAYYPCRREWRFNFQNFAETEYPISFVDSQGYPDQSGVYAEVYTNNRIPGLQF